MTAPTLAQRLKALQEEVEDLRKKQEEFVGQRELIDEGLAEARNLLGWDTETAPTPRRTKVKVQDTPEKTEKPSSGSVKKRVLDALSGTKEPLTAGEVAAAMMKQGWKTFLQTDEIMKVVNAGIATLLQQGKIVKTGDSPNIKYATK